MNERELVKNIIEFSFLIKAQLASEETTLLRSALAVVIMEAEDVLENMDHSPNSSINLRENSDNARRREA